jgi:hypothetical protein
MSEIEKTKKIKEIYERNVFLPSQNNICGIITKDNAAYKCPSNKFCNYGGQVGICENTNCMPDAFVNKPINMDYRKFDGSDVSRNMDVSGNIKSSYCNRKISTDGKCGLDNNNTKCPDGQCCSIKGNCGNDKESCLYIGPRYNNPTTQFISPYYNDISNNIVATVNREFYSKYGDVMKYEEEFIKQIGKKYVGNNNFEISTDGKCGLDLEKEKIFKCSDIQYCDKIGKCSTDYKNYNTPSDNIYLNFPDLSLNLMHGNKFNEEYNKYYDNRKKKLESIHNKYINNNLEISTDGRCGIDLENEKIFKCSDNQYCNNIGKCSTNYDNISTLTFNNYDLTDLSLNKIYLNKQYETTLKDLSLNLISDKLIKKYSNLKDETRLKDLSTNLMNGDKFNEELDKWLDDKIKNNQFEKSYNLCGKIPNSGVVYKCKYDNHCCINNNCKYGEICKNADPNSKFHGDSFNQNSILSLENSKVNQNIVPLDCNNSKILDSFKTQFHNINDNELNIVGNVKTNKVDDNTCDFKYFFNGKFSGKDNRRIVVYPYMENWDIYKIGDPGTGETVKQTQLYKNGVPLDCNNSKLLDSYKLEFSENNNKELNIVGNVKTNKVDNNTCDFQYYFNGKFSGQENRRITLSPLFPYIGDWFIDDIGDSKSGLTTPLNIDFPVTTIVYIVITGVIILALFIYFVYSKYK